MKQVKFGFLSTGNRLPAVFLMSAMLALAGCGGSSSSGGDTDDTNDQTPPEKVNQDLVTISGEGDAEAGALAARKTAEQAIVEERVDASSLLGGGTSSGIQILPASAQSDIQGPCGGSANVTPLGDGADDGFKSTFNNYCVDNDDGTKTVVNGYIATSGSGLDLSVDADYTVKTGGETYTVRQSCTSNGCFNLLNSGGVSYRTYDVDVSEPDTNGAYDVEARVCTDDEGCITYEATGLKECASGNGFSGGTISIADSTNTEVVTVTFSGCSSYTVTFGGTGYTVNY